LQEVILVSEKHPMPSWTCAFAMNYKNIVKISDQVKVLTVLYFPIKNSRFEVQMHTEGIVTLSLLTNEIFHRNTDSCR
jgi:hypothetical protein